ncbi:MAG: hypothetical protein AB4063_22155, partial [Crocosphaera sp.]
MEDEKNHDQENKSQKEVTQKEDKSLDKNLKDIDSMFPDEVAEEIKKLPPEVRKSLTMLSISGGISPSSDIAKSITSEQISQIIDSSDKENEREYQKFQISESTKRYSILSILLLVLMILIYTGLTKDVQLSEKIIT